MHSIEAFNSSHIPIIYAAALSGCDTTPTVAAERFIGFGNTKHGYGPACILDIAGTPYVAEPHVTWFPWTSLADRIINFKWAMKFLGEQREVFLTVEKSQIKFFDHFVKRGVLRKVGYLENLPIVEEIHMYQYNRRTV